MAFGFADKGGRTGDPPKPQFLLKHLRPILPAMIRTADQARGDVLPKHPPRGAHPWADGLQGFTPWAMHGRMEAHTRSRTMVHRDHDSSWTILSGASGGPISAPHRVDALGEARPVRGFGAVGVPRARGSQQTVGRPRKQHP